MSARLVLIVGVLAISTAALFIRLADAPVLVIAASRLVLASFAMAAAVPFMLRGRIILFSLSDLILPTLAGVLMALHFVFWIASLELTSVASSVILVTAHPLFVALAAPLVTGDRLSPRVLGYAALGTLGAVIIGWGDLSLTPAAFMGDILALIGGLLAGGFLLVGRRAREAMPLSLYLLIAYGTAALLLAAAVVVMRLPVTGFSGQTYLALLLLALVPQLIGHSIINGALRRLSTAAVSVSILGEPVGATLLALLFLREAPPATSLLGGGVILLSIYLALRAEGKDHYPALPAEGAGGR